MRHQIDGVFGSIDDLPGCTQVAVSHGVYVPKDKRGQGLGFGAQLKRQKMCFDELGYDMMLCTVDSENRPQQKILLNTGWKWLTWFKSRKTGHIVDLYARTRPTDMGDPGGG
jgi:RimJ/RimL family protein N-acetyltransferase